MRKIFGAASGLMAACVGLMSLTTRGLADPSTYYNATAQQGIFLPPMPAQTGFDEVRGADGTACRSSMGNNGAFLDAGAIANDSPEGNSAGGMIYGRIIVPLGERTRRIDCTRLYELEIKRLQHELQLVRMGGNVKGTTQAENVAAPKWQIDGWTTKARRVDGAEVLPDQALVTEPQKK